jgi:signal transduction histidine kinase
MSSRSRCPSRTILLAFVCAVLAGCVRQETAARFTQVDYWKQSDAAIAVSAQTQWSRQDLPQIIRKAPAFIPSGVAVWETHWYRVRLSDIEQRNFAIYIPRVRWPRHQGGLNVVVNGVSLDSAGIVWNSPVLLNIPRGALAGAKELEVLIGLSLERGQSGGISNIWVGPAEELSVRKAWREFFQQRIPQVSGISFGIVGVFALIFWLVRRNESAYLLFAIAAALNLLRNAHYYFVNPESFGDAFWWLTINSLAWTMLAAHLFAVRLHGQHFPRTERGLMAGTALVCIGSLFAVLSGVTIERWGPLAYLAQIVIGILVPTLSTIGAWRARSKMALLLAAILWLNVVLGVHDFLLQNWRITPESVILLPYGALAILGIFLASIGTRYFQAISGAEQLALSLESRLAERSRELEDSHRKLRIIEQEQAIVGERQRLMREMHDGLGSSLMSSLVMVERGQLDNAQVASVLRESIDDLKLTIDSLEPMENDLLTLLGTLRYRLGRRLETAGIRLEWNVDETPPITWLNPTSSLQILRILQEALTNVLKHARATVIRVSTTVDADQVSIHLMDNGNGFDVAAMRKQPTGRGLQNLDRRAATLSAGVDIESQQGNTVVTLRLPLDRRNVPRDRVP